MMRSEKSRCNTYSGIIMKQLGILSVVSTLLSTIMLVAITGCGAQHNRTSSTRTETPSEFQTTESGLKYRILNQGSSRRPKPSDQVLVDYTGRLEDGTLFDSSYEKAKPATLYIANTVPGWFEGIQLIGEGGVIELDIPPELGYGPAGNPPVIPPNARLRFKIELRSIQ